MKYTCGIKKFPARKGGFAANKPSRSPCPPAQSTVQVQEEAKGEALNHLPHEAELHAVNHCPLGRVQETDEENKKN